MYRLNNYLPKTFVLVLLFGLGLSLCLSGCQGTGNSTQQEDLLSRLDGDVSVLLLGKSGCSGTEKATRFFTNYCKSKPENVKIVRVDVPPPGMPLKPVKGWNKGFQYEIDKDRRLAEKLDFFYYPTLYIMDKDQDVRYCGECDTKRIPGIINELLAEEPGAENKLYSIPVLAVGETAKEFSGTNLTKRKVNFRDFRGSKATLLVFSSTTCPFSANAITKMPDIVNEYKARGIKGLIVNVGESPKPLQMFYNEKAPNVPVINDPNNKVGKDMYGVMGVPFFFLFDEKGAVVDRMPFTAEAAKEAINAYLEGRMSSAKEKAASGAG